MLRLFLCSFVVLIACELFSQAIFLNPSIEKHIYTQELEEVSTLYALSFAAYSEQSLKTDINIRVGGYCKGLSILKKECLLLDTVLSQVFISGLKQINLSDLMLSLETDRVVVEISFTNPFATLYYQDNHFAHSCFVSDTVFSYPGKLISNGKVYENNRRPSLQLDLEKEQRFALFEETVSFSLWDGLPQPQEYNMGGYLSTLSYNSDKYPDFLIGNEIIASTDSLVYQLIEGVFPDNSSFHYIGRQRDTLIFLAIDHEISGSQRKLSIYTYIDDSNAAKLIQSIETEIDDIVSIIYTNPDPGVGRAGTRQIMMCSSSGIFCSISLDEDHRIKSHREFPMELEIPPKNISLDSNGKIILSMWSGGIVAIDIENGLVDHCDDLHTGDYIPELNRRSGLSMELFNNPEHVPSSIRFWAWSDLDGNGINELLIVPNQPCEPIAIFEREKGKLCRRFFVSGISNFSTQSDLLIVDLNTDGQPDIIFRDENYLASLLNTSDADKEHSERIVIDVTSPHEAVLSQNGFPLQSAQTNSGYLIQRPSVLITSTDFLQNKATNIKSKMNLSSERVNILTHKREQDLVISEGDFQPRLSVLTEIFETKLNITVSSPRQFQGVLELVSSEGAIISTIYQGQFHSGEMDFVMSTESLSGGIAVGSYLLVLKRNGIPTVIRVMKI